MRGVAHELAGGSMRPIGADPTELDSLREQLSRGARRAPSFGRKAIGAARQAGRPARCDPRGGRRTRTSASRARCSRRCARCACYYKSKAVLRWAAGHSISKRRGGGRLRRRHGAAVQDQGPPAAGSASDGAAATAAPRSTTLAWFVLSTRRQQGGHGRVVARVRRPAREVQDVPAVRHAQRGDRRRALHARVEREQAAVPRDARAAAVCPDADAGLQRREGRRLPQGVGRDLADAVHAARLPARPCPRSRARTSRAAPLDDPNHADPGCPVHAQIDLLHNRGRFPALMPHTSTRVRERVADPLADRLGHRGERDGRVRAHGVQDGGHPALRQGAGPQGAAGEVSEQRPTGAPPCLRADALDRGAARARAEGGARAAVLDRRAADGVDDRARRALLQHEQEAGGASSFNRRLRARAAADRRSRRDLPEISLRYPGFPTDRGEPKLRLVSVPVGDSAPADEAKKVEISKANPLQSIDAELLRYQTEVAIGRAATSSTSRSTAARSSARATCGACTGDVFTTTRGRTTCAPR